MENISPFLAMQQLERQLKALLRGVDTDALERAEKKVLTSIRLLLVEARLDIRDYELSETREEQIKKMHAAQRRLGKLESSVLAVSFMFGAADIAQLTAQIEHIQGRLL